MQHDFDAIKAVLWDLDETLWAGTVGEGAVELSELHRETLRQLSHAGIVQSICSKNDFRRAEAELVRLGIREYFVFPSIDWTPKGPRVAAQIRQLRLREQNVLFVDDNPSAVEEVKFYFPGIMTARPADIAALCDQARVRAGSGGGEARLQQYRLLEKTAQALQAFGTNEAFLFSSDIRVEIHAECTAAIDRILDLISRTNQLNFTKVRSGRAELMTLLHGAGVRAGYVTVTDKFGAYGIVGFFAIAAGELRHFLFSCRVLGMGIERYVYDQLGRPKLRVRGDVVGDLAGGSPGWINQAGRRRGRAGRPRAEGGAHTVLMKGPCDLNQIFPFIRAGDCIDTEFTYVSPKSGVTIEQASHTTQIVQARTLTPAQKARVIGELPFADENMYSDAMFHHPYRLVFISVLMDANLGVYRRRETGELVAFAEAHYPLTDRAHWDGYAAGEYFDANCRLTREFLAWFAQHYEFAGCNTSEHIAANIRFIRDHLAPECRLAILLGSEVPFERNDKPAYVGRHLVHRDINDRLRRLCDGLPNTQCVELDHYVTGQDCYFDQYNHFTKRVYYAMAQDIVRIINESAPVAVRRSGRHRMWYRLLRQRLRGLVGA